ncbi:MAG TPA: ATP-dependent Clp protease proteolytic subunit [Nocardioidaceae bacterium]|nr:ATP-dependent Clp protease proteolytic subunit [Nocardioidaceae bacterium]
MATYEHRYSHPLRDTGTWPPEVPPFRPPGPPTEPPGPPGPPGPQPSPILPSWEEPDPRAFEHDVADRLLAQRVVTMSGRLDDATADHVTRQLLLLGRDDPESPISLHLSCSDSELGAALALADAVDLAGAPVHAVVHGTLRGPAVAVLCAATRRAAHRHALVVLSLPEVSGAGTAARLASLAEQHEQQVAQLCGRIAEVTGRPVDSVGSDLETGRLLSAEQAMDYGLVDEIV